MSDFTSAPTVIVIGSAHVDLIAHAARLPVRGETLPGFRFGIHPGGKGGNQAVAVARAGARSIFFGRLGRDAFGDQLVAALSDAGVDLTCLEFDEHVGTGCSTVLTGEGGDYASIIVPGSSLTLTPDHIREANDIFLSARAIVGQLEIDPYVTAVAMAAGRAAEATTILNAAPAPASVDDLPPNLLEMVDVLIVNRVEAGMLLGYPPGSPFDPSDAVVELQRKFRLQAVIITLGEMGVRARVDDQSIMFDAFPVTPVDTIGAGDAFTGTLAAALADHVPWPDALRRANAAGAIAVTRVGGYSASPKAIEINAFLEAL
ncbi:MAG: ribokinase [Thermomicrobiales bacterium]